MPDIARMMVAAVLGAALALIAQHFLAGANSDDSFAGGGDGAINQEADPYGSATEQQVRIANLELGQKRLVEELEAMRATTAFSGVGSDLSVSEPLADAETLAAPRAQGRTNPVDTSVASVQALTAAGVNSVDAQAMVERLDALALARLEADYQVRRESGTGEAARQARLDRRAIPRDSETIREEFGDQAYDQYLYSLNQPNRVQVAGVLGESIAQGAGIQQGDLLRSLDGEPLFSVRDLTQRVSQGDPDQTYALSVERPAATTAALFMV